MARKAKTSAKSVAPEVAVLQAEMAQVKADLATIKTDQKAMLLELTKYRGIWGGVMLVVTAIWAAVTLLRDNIIGFFGGTPSGN